MLTGVVSAFGDTAICGCTGIAANGSVRPLGIWVTRASGGRVWSKPVTPTGFAGCLAANGLSKGCEAAEGEGLGATGEATGVGVVGVGVTPPVPPPSLPPGQPLTNRASTLTNPINET